VPAAPSLRLVSLFLRNGVSPTRSIQNNAIHNVKPMASYAATLLTSSFAQRSARWILGAALALNGYSWATPPEANRSSAAEASAEDAIVRAGALLNAAGDNPRQRSLALAEYRSAVMKLLPILQDKSVVAHAGAERKFFHRHEFSDVTPVERSWRRASGLRRNGLGVPVVGRLAESGVTDPNAPSSGFVLAATALVLPDSDGHMELVFADPTKVETIKAFGQELPLAMDLEAWLDQVEATGPPPVAGVRQMLRPEKFEGRSRLTFLQPFDPDKIPVLLIHGLMSTPRMWKPVLDGLLADEEIRTHYQFWSFYYPTGQPVPFSALQLRQALSEAASRYPLREPLVLIGHSMGGVLARAQVSGISATEAEKVVPNIGSLPGSSLARNAIIFEPRTDIGRIIFIATPHQGSTVAMGNVAALGMRLIDLPTWIVSELESLSIDSGQLPTSIHGLSPNSQFLQALQAYRPSVPVHSIIGDRGHNHKSNSSDGVVSYSSSHLDFAESELVIPAGHGGFTHPEAIAEIARILKSTRQNE
jgi:Alpha/beta hydrolase family